MVNLLEIKQDLDSIELDKYTFKIADSLSKELSTTAVERDMKGGVPEHEVQLLYQSGLLSLVIPKEYGGIGATWSSALKIVQKLSESDGSIGHLFGNHLTLTILGHVSGTSEQKERFYRETVRNNHQAQ